MKPLSLLFIFTAFIAHAASNEETILKNEELRQSIVQVPFNLRASDGSLVTLTPANPAQLKTVSLIGKTLQFTTDTGKTVNFAVASRPEEIEDFSDLYNVSIPAATSNQNLSVSIFHGEDNKSIAPSTRRTTESCTITSQVRTCDPSGKCWTQTVTQNGKRTVETTTQFVDKTYLVTFSNGQHLHMYIGEISEGKFESERNESPCFP